jgi:ketosteroid isomerase-like protein
MFDHVKFGVSDFAASKAFFLKALEPLGVVIAAEGEPTYGIELVQKGGKASLILHQSAEKPAHLHLAFMADTREQVEAFYRAALAAGGKDNGGPGLRPNYHANYYAAFVIGPDGHNIEAVCHEPDAAGVEALKATYAALNRNDIEGIVKAFDPQIAWIEPAGYPGGGTYTGLEAVKAHLSWARGTWGEGSCDPERFVVAGDKVVVFLHVHVRLAKETEWREGRHAAVYTFRNGKAIEMRIFDDTREALEWAGAKA